jgi:hypothetical protein
MKKAAQANAAARRCGLEVVGSVVAAAGSSEIVGGEATSATGL